MTLIEANKLKHGLYEVFWIEGGSSLAALGSLHNGDRWLAPCNWTSPNEIKFNASYWGQIERVELIKEVEYYKD